MSEPIPADPTTRREAVVWVLAAVATIAGRTIVRAASAVGRAARAWLEVPEPRGKTMAFFTVGLFIAFATRVPARTVTVGPEHVNAASEAPAAPRVDPLLQDGYADPAAGEDDRAAVDDPMAPLVPGDAQGYAAPGGPPDLGPPPFLTSGLAPHWPEIDRSAREHSLDPWAWAAVIVVECPLGVDSYPAPSCMYANASDAAGLAQVTSDTGAMIAAQSGYRCVADRFDPLTSLRCGAFHFADLLRATGAIWSPDNELPALQLAAIGYNAGPGSVAYSGARAAAASGGDACAGIPAGFDSQTHRYCRDMRDMWQQAVMARGAAVPYIEPVAPGGPDHLEVTSVQP